MGVESEVLAIIEAHSTSLCGDSGRLSIRESLDRKKIDRAIKVYADSLDPDDVICMIDDSMFRNGATGFLFTSKKLYFSFAPPKEEKVWYDEIDDVSTYFDSSTDTKPIGVNVKMKDGSTCKLHGSCVDAEVLAELLTALRDNATAASYAFVRKISFMVEDASASTAVAGMAAAQSASDKNSAGHLIQSRYSASGDECIDSLFSEDGTGEYRYIDDDGSPMVVEVPKDEAIYRKAVDKMGQKIAEGKVPGVTDVSEASNLVQQGSVTFEQAQNIAKAGNIDSILFDSAGSLVICASAFGLSAIIVFATSVWNDEPVDVALKKAAVQGLKIGGSTFVASVLASQIGRTGLSSSLVAGTESIASQSASRAMGSNIVTATLTITVLSAFDVADIFRGRISGSQLFKNISGTATSVVGGTAGWVTGSAVGNMVMPGVGGAIGGLVGSVVAGSASSKAAYTVLDKFIEDDANEMVEIIQARFQKHAEGYLLNKSEAEKIVDALSAKLDGNTLKMMYASENRDDFADDLLLPLIEYRVSRRPHIILPSTDEMNEAMRKMLSELEEDAGWGADNSAGIATTT